MHESQQEVPNVEQGLLQLKFAGRPLRGMTSASVVNRLARMLHAQAALKDPVLCPKAGQGKAVQGFLARAGRHG